jgi:hypothetical protein
MCLDRVARVGEDDEILAPDEELARRPGDLLLAVGEGESSEVAHVLSAQPEVGVDPGRVEAGTEPGETGRPGGPIGLRPAGVIGRRRRWREVRRGRKAGRRPRAAAHVAPYFAMFA